MRPERLLEALKNDEISKESFNILKEEYNIQQTRIRGKQ